MSETTGNEESGERVDILDMSQTSEESSDQEESLYSNLSPSEENGSKEDKLGASPLSRTSTQVNSDATIILSAVKNSTKHLEHRIDVSLNHPATTTEAKLNLSEIDSRDKTLVEGVTESVPRLISIDENFEDKKYASVSTMENSVVIIQNSISDCKNRDTKIPLLAGLGLSAKSSVSDYTRDSDSTGFPQAENPVFENTETKPKGHTKRHEHHKSSKKDNYNDLRVKQVSGMPSLSKKGQIRSDAESIGGECSSTNITCYSNKQNKKKVRKCETTARPNKKWESVPEKVAVKPRRLKQVHPGLVEPSQSADQSLQQNNTGIAQPISRPASKVTHANGNDKLVPNTKIDKQKPKKPSYNGQSRDSRKLSEQALSTEHDLRNPNHGTDGRPGGAVGYSKYHSRSSSEPHKKKLGPSESYHRKSLSINNKVQVKQPFKSEKVKTKTRPVNQTQYRDSNTSGRVVEAIVTKGNNDIMEIEDPFLLLTNLAAKIEGMEVECDSKYRKEFIELKEALSKNVKQKVFLHEYENVEAEKDNIMKCLDECYMRKETFLEYCSELKKEIKKQLHPERQTMERALHAYIALQRSFERECKRYENALPIYSWRSEILNVVHKHQTCVLIGETGSGKSTQLVQYLYETGYAEHGFIACTQPRKLAARSLADHVSKEAGKHGGTTYSYFGSDSPWKKDAKVVFMTDHTLLNECIADRRLSKYTVIVIDEAHERSIHTDILIALIKRCLPDRQDLRVIVTSATINPTMFSYYFGGFHTCPVIEVPGRVYPVDLKWDNSKDSVLERNYVTDSVGTAYDIHVKNKGNEGDILIFLTSPAEIEQACKLAQATMKNEVIVLPLHGQLQLEEQQKVFGKTTGKRKVVFSTNVAETSVTIPGIKFVIDTGLSKEMCYDSQRNMNSLEIRPISKSSANQRKGRAGRTGPGECYRLFSERDYKAMRDDSTPEILRITLSFAVIKLYEFGINDIHSFEFVDAPNKKALDDAVENLKFHGAIKDGKLTDIGKKMALLPLEPNLSKVLLDAINKGIGAIGAAAVAISSLAGQIFFRPTGEERIEERDQSRLPFCQDSGDQMTNLHTYFDWYNQSKNDRNDWCKRNYVNGKSMHMVKEMVHELVMILNKKRSNLKVSPSLESLSNADDILPKLFFDAFLNNLCVHLGHDKIGYWCEKLPTEQLVLHYGSSLRYLRSYPQCVIFEKTQKTSQHFMLQVLPVREEWIQSAIESGRLPYHPCQAPLYSNYCVSCFTISNLGPTIISKLRVKYHPDRRNPVIEFLDFETQPLFEYSKQKGELKVTCQKCCHDKIRESIDLYVEDIKKDFKNETHEDGIVSGNDDVRVIMAEGGVIQQVLMPDEFRGIKVHGLQYRFKDIASEELEQYGECKIECGKYIQDGTIQFFVKYENSSDARHALQHTFNGFEDPCVVIYRLLVKNRTNFCLKVTWVRRLRQKYAYVNFDDEGYAIISEYLGRKRDYRTYDHTSFLTFQRTDQKSIKVEGILPHMDTEFIKSRLQFYWPDVTKFEIVFLYYDKAFKENIGNYKKQKLALDDAISGCVLRRKYFLDLQFPRDKTVHYVANIHFDDSDDCLAAQMELNQRHTKYNAKMVLSSSVRYTPQIFSVIQPSIKYIADKFPESITYNSRDSWGNVFVKITANDIDIFMDVRDAISKAAEPSTINLNENESMYACTNTSMKIRRKIEAKTGTHIRVQNLKLGNNTLKIHGIPESIKKAKEMVEKDLAYLANPDINFYEIYLTHPSILKHVIHKYGPQAEEMEKDFNGITATRIDYKKHVLSLFSTQSSHDNLLKYLESVEVNTVISQRVIPHELEFSENVECCACYEQHNSDTDYYRLEICGHVYCKVCIQTQLDPLTIAFPVTCAAHKCEQSLVWKDFDNLFKSKVIWLKDIKSSALKHFVFENSTKYHHCITPDCDVVYLITEKGERFICSQCGANICTRCHGNWHEGYDTCAAYQNRKERDTTVDDWMCMNRRIRKRCPKCKVPIEKNGGCRHVHCIKCKAHTCWICLQYYDTASKCNDHLSSKHGGIFDVW